MSAAALIRAAATPLSTADTKTLFDEIFAGRVAEADLVSYLAATADRKPTVDELVGAVTSMRAHMHAVEAPPGAIDLCGTGGDGLGTLNISTAVSFVVAACGVPVAKHGNRSASSRSGAADTLETLGINLGVAPKAAAHILAATGMAFLFAQTHHPAMRHVGPARKQIGRRTIFNLLGPLANPARVRRQLVGVFASDWLLPYAEALRALGSERAWVVHGRDGLDELTTTGATDVTVLEGGRIEMRSVTPEDAGLKRVSLADLRGSTPQENAAALRRLLEGETGAYRDIVLLNAAAALIVAGNAKNLREGVAQAASVIDKGDAKRVLEKLVMASNA